LAHLSSCLQPCPLVNKKSPSHFQLENGPLFITTSVGPIVDQLGWARNVYRKIKNADGLIEVINHIWRVRVPSTAQRGESTRHLDLLPSGGLTGTMAGGEIRPCLVPQNF